MYENEAVNLANMEELERYRAIDTVEVCRTAVERMRPKKAIPNKNLEEGAYIKWTCPNCGKVKWEGYYYLPITFDKVCTDCLQAIDWSGSVSVLEELENSFSDEELCAISADEAEGEYIAAHESW